MSFEIIIHQAELSVQDLKGQKSQLLECFEQNNDNKSLHLFPELFLGGYPLQDLCLGTEFILQYQKTLNELDEFAKTQEGHQLILFGGLAYQTREDQFGELKVFSIKNVIYQLSPTHGLKELYAKILLPSYDIFDETKYFSPGKDPAIIEHQSKRLGLMICEDMWPSLHYEIDPIDFYTHEKLDYLINLSASPFHVKKRQKRLERAYEISKKCSCPFIYVNQRGAQDDITFDGHSFMMNAGDHTLKQGQQESLIKLSKLASQNFKSRPKNNGLEHSWADVYHPRLTQDFKLQELSEEDMQEVIEAISIGLNSYLKMSSMKSVLVALSGGIDSGLVLTLARKVLPKSIPIEAFYMPGLYSKSLSYDLSLELCKNINVPLRVFPIKFTHKELRQSFKHHLNLELANLADENIQARLRGALLYALANQQGSMVLNTSNKSELAVGYSTQYGDSVGAISVIGDLYKTDVFALSRYLNKDKEIIPHQMIERPPSAELREDQKDSDSLPPYDLLDPILEAFITQSRSFGSIKQHLLNQQIKINLEHLWRLYDRSEYKRYQFAPIIKIFAKSFGFGHRKPINRKSLI